jgi:cytochrome c553
MKKKILVPCILILVGVVFITVGVLLAADVATKTTTPGGTTINNELTINNTGYSKDIKGPVVFHHLKHSKDYKVACTDCHHEYKDGKNIWKEGTAVKTCVTCHDPEKDQDNAKKLQTAFHTNCKECHKKSGKETAPSTKCNDCHSKV